MSQVRFITGSSRGIDRALAEAGVDHRGATLGEYIVTHVWRRRFSRNASPATNTACSKGRRHSCEAIRYGRARAATPHAAVLGCVRRPALRQRSERGRPPVVPPFGGKGVHDAHARR